MHWIKNYGRAETAHCGFWFEETNLVTEVQRQFCIRYGRETLSRRHAYEWHKDLYWDWVFCRKERWPLSHEVQNRWTRTVSPRKSNYRASREVSVSQLTMWKIWRNTLHTELCKMLTYQASKPDDKIKHRTSCDDMWPRFERARYVLTCVTFICVRFVSLWNWRHKVRYAGKWPTPYDYGICRQETSAVGSLL